MLWQKDTRGFANLKYSETEIKKISNCCDVQPLMNSLQIPKSIQHDILLSSKHHQSKQIPKQILTIRYDDDQDDEKEEIIYGPAVEFNKKRKTQHMLHV